MSEFESARAAYLSAVSALQNARATGKGIAAAMGAIEPARRAYDNAARDRFVDREEKGRRFALYLADMANRG